MAETYFYFVTGYLALWAISFVGIGVALAKVLKLEKKLKIGEPS